MFIALIELLSGKTITKKYKKQTAHRIQQLDNMEIVLETLKEEGLRLISMSEYSHMLDKTGVPTH